MNVTCKCTIRLLDDTEVIQTDFQSTQKGQYLLDYTCKQLNLIEKDYFGLRYVDHQNKQRHWLDVTRNIIKQVKDMEPIILCFRVKFYPADPFKLREEVTRYQVYSQLRRDLLHGRLYCSPSDAAQLASYVVQAEIGDFDPALHTGIYIADFKLLLKQTAKLEEKIMENHQTQLKGQTPAMAEMNFLRKACLMDTYGVDPHPVRDHRGSQLYLGINHAGILTFQGSKKTHHFRWNDVQKINYEGKMFIIHLVFSEKKHTVGFKCPTGSACKHLWRCAVEQRLFFTLNSSAEAPSIVTGGSIFSFGSKFRYSGRVEKEILQDAAHRREEASKSSAKALPRKSQSVPATPSTPSDGYESLPRSNHSVPLPDRSHLEDDILYGLDIPLNSPYCPGDNTMPLQLEPLLEDPERVPLPRCRSADETSRSNGEWQHVNMKGRNDLDDGMHIEAIEEESIDAVTPMNKIRPLPLVRQLSRAESLPPEVEAVDDPMYESSAHRSQYDYYYQGYFKHSSSETHLDDPYSLSRGTQTPVRSQSVGDPSPLPQQQRKFSIIRVFIPAFLFVAVTLVILIVVVLESESELFSGLRRMPEMVLLRRDYYEPVKEYILSKLDSKGIV